MEYRTPVKEMRLKMLEPTWRFEERRESQRAAAGDQARGRQGGERAPS